MHCANVFGIVFTLVSFVHVAHMAWIIACYIQFVVNGVLKFQCVEAEDSTLMKTRHGVWSTETTLIIPSLKERLIVYLRILRINSAYRKTIHLFYT